jgi:hypothetical protein
MKYADFYAKVQKIAAGVSPRTLAVAMSSVNRGIDYRGCSKSDLMEGLDSWAVSKDLCKLETLVELQVAIVKEEERIRKMQQRKNDEKAERVMRNAAIDKAWAELTDILGCLETGQTCGESEKKRFFKWAQRALNMRASIGTDS